MPFFKVKVHLNSVDATWSERATLVYKQLLDEVFVISGIIKVEVSVISRS